jgi:hypothetical protein
MMDMLSKRPSSTPQASHTTLASMPLCCRSRDFKAILMAPSMMSAVCMQQGDGVN